MADELGISGTVQNQPDGTVRIEAEGEDDALRHFEAWCKTGPPLAKVERTVVTSGALKHFSKFVIVR
jgi:acylphosphatase